MICFVWFMLQVGKKTDFYSEHFCNFHPIWNMHFPCTAVHCHLSLLTYILASTMIQYMVSPATSFAQTSKSKQSLTSCLNLPFCIVHTTFIFFVWTSEFNIMNTSKCGRLFLFFKNNLFSTNHSSVKCLKSKANTVLLSCANPLMSFESLGQYYKIEVVFYALPA